MHLFFKSTEPFSDLIRVPEEARHNINLVMPEVFSFPISDFNLHLHLPSMLKSQILLLFGAVRQTRFLIKSIYFHIGKFKK